MDTVTNNESANSATWKEEGLPGRPAVFVGTGSAKTNTWRWLPIGELIRDHMGKVITAPIHGDADKLMTAHLGKTIEAVKLYALRETENTPDITSVLETVAFRCMGVSRLSMMDRRVVAAFAWTANNYYAPMKRRGRVVFPTILDNLPKELQSTSRYIPMWKSFTEDKAIQVASVLEMMFSDVVATVFEDGDGWFVRIDAKENEFYDAATLERVETIMWLLSDFDVVPNEQCMRIYGAGFMDDLNMDGHIHRRSVRAFNAYDAQQRIEDGINAILAHLGHPVADSIATGKELVENIEAHARERRSRPASTGKTSASKRSA